jgi:hypothetical protein
MTTLLRSQIWGDMRPFGRSWRRDQRSTVTKFARIADGNSIGRIDELMPWCQRSHDVGAAP